MGLPEASYQPLQSNDDLSVAKRAAQERGRAEIRSGKYTQADMFMIRRDVARRAIVTLVP